jgi:polysaccharide pyruvyl transferase WcaK-like protein
MAAESVFWGARLQRLRGMDLLIVAGSNQLSDYFGGPWGFPYSVWAWSAAARLRGTRLVFLSVGAGPIRSRLSRYFIRMALGWSAYASVRDVGSRDTVTALGASTPPPIAPDLAQGLKLDQHRGARRGGSTKRTVVVIPIPYFDPRYWAESDQTVYDRYVSLLVAFARTLLDRGDRVRFVPTQLRADPPVIADVMRALDRTIPIDPADRIDPPVATLADLIELLDEADAVVATRFHGVVLAQLLGKPTVGIAYRRSTTDLLMDVGQGAYAVDIKVVTLEGLLGLVDALDSDPAAQGRIEKRLGDFREALSAQYDVVLGAPGGGEGRDAASTPRV